MTVLLIDGLNLIRRVYAGVPEDVDDRSEKVSNACLASARRALRRHQPSHAILVMEVSGKSWRAQEFPDYKKNRPAMPTDLKQSLPSIEAAFSGIGIHSLAAEGFEADDTIASIAVRTRQMGIPTVILSTDKSFCQLVGSCITLFDHFNEKERDISWIIEHFGAAPEKLVDLMTLAGDPGLSIPGIRNVGVQTASRLLDQYDSVDQLLLHVADIPGKLGENIRQGIENIELTRKLVTLRQDVHLGLNLQNFRYSDPETGAAFQ